MFFDVFEVDNRVRGRSRLRPARNTIRPEGGRSCSFCGLSRGQVSFIASGPGVFACDYCLVDARAILDPQDLS